MRNQFSMFAFPGRVLLCQKYGWTQTGSGERKLDFDEVKGRAVKCAVEVAVAKSQIFRLGRAVAANRLAPSGN